MSDLVARYSINSTTMDEEDEDDMYAPEEGPVPSVPKGSKGEGTEHNEEDEEEGEELEEDESDSVGALYLLATAHFLT